MKYEFIETYRSEFTVIRMCRALKVFESGYYRWKNKVKSIREIDDEKYAIEIRKIHEESKYTYGPTRIKTKLEKNGIQCSLGRIRRLMRENGIYSNTRMKKRPYPKEKVETRYNDNIVSRQFDVHNPNKIWCDDITYIKTIAGWVYLAVVIDLFNREVVGHSLNKKPNSELTKRTMANALMNRKPSKKLMFHGDRGCQYSSKHIWHISRSIASRVA